MPKPVINIYIMLQMQSLIWSSWFNKELFNMNCILHSSKWIWWFCLLSIPPPFPHHINYSLYLSAFLKMILTVLPPPSIIRIRRTSHVFLELGMDGTNLCNQTWSTFQTILFRTLIIEQASHAFDIIHYMKMLTIRKVIFCNWLLFLQLVTLIPKSEVLWCFGSFFFYKSVM